MSGTKITKEDILQAISEMNVIEVCALANMITKKFDLPDMAAMSMGRGVAAQESSVEEQDAFDVVLIATGESKINVIKALRTITTLGLKEAKDAVDSVSEKPYIIKQGIPKEEAVTIQKQFVEAGATVELK